MGTCTGDDLVQMFNNMNIDMGDLNSNVIRGWFDTNCESTKNLLTWLCTSFDKNNVLTALECEEYDYLVSKNLVFEEEHLEREVAAIEKKMPDLLEVEETKFDVEMMEEEIKVLLEEEKNQNDLINTYENIKLSFNKEINKAHNKEVEKNLEKEKAYENCLLVSKKLDEAHKKIPEIIYRYKTNLDNFENATIPHFFASMDLEQYNKNYLAITENCLSIDKCTLSNNKTCSDLSVTKIFSNSHQMEELEVIQNRILKSQKKCLTLKVNKVQVEAAIEKLKSISAVNVNSNTNNSTDIEMYVKEKQDYVQKLLKVLMGLMERISLSKVFYTKTEIIKAETEMKMQKLHKLDSFYDKICTVLRDQILIEMFLNAEEEIMNEVLPFLKNVNHYINKDLHCCQSRMTKVLQSIEENNIRKSVPVEKSNHLIDMVKLLLSENSEKECKLQEIFDLVSNFYMKQNIVEHQLLQVDYENHRLLCRPIEKDIRVLQKFLHNESCNQLLLIPYELQKLFILMESFLKKEKNEILSSIQAQAEAKKKMPQSKWNVMQRHLWMYFMESPEVVLQVIKEIEQATKNVI